MDGLLTNPRIQLLNQHPVGNGACVVYVMSRDQRIKDNHALLFAQKTAIGCGLPLHVVFVVRTDNSYGRAREHYQFMYDGLKQVGSSLLKLNISFSVTTESLGLFVDSVRAAAVFFDYSPLAGSRSRQAILASKLERAVATVDTHNIVPVWQASPKQEVGARTLRPKIHRALPEYLHEPVDIVKHPVGRAKLSLGVEMFNTTVLNIKSNHQTLKWISGELAALNALNYFLDNGLAGYAERRNDPTIDFQSNLSPYLHFGQLSSLRVALECTARLAFNPDLQHDVDVFLEELIVRKELSDNFCYYNANYKNLSGAPNWAQTTLEKHRADERAHLYSQQEFLDAQTHDPAWNAAQRQLITTGKMHGYMRMYWAKKVLEWSQSPQKALDILVELNDFYSIDGGDPNGYVGILWSIGGLHDRPWGERPVYGTVRSMVYNGLRRKFDISAYEKQWLS